MVYNFFDKNIESGVNLSKVLAQKLQKPVTEKFRTRKV